MGFSTKSTNQFGVPHGYGKPPQRPRLQDASAAPALATAAAVRASGLSGRAGAGGEEDHSAGGAARSLRSGRAARWSKREETRRFPWPWGYPNMVKKKGKSDQKISKWLITRGTSIYENHHMENDMMGVYSISPWTLVILMGTSEYQTPNFGEL